MDVGFLVSSVSHVLIPFYKPGDIRDVVGVASQRLDAPATSNIPVEGYRARGVLT